MNIIPPSYKFYGDSENSRMAKAIGLKFYYDVANRLEKEGLPSLSVTGVISDTLTIIINTYKNSVNKNISGNVSIYTTTPKEESEPEHSNIDIVFYDSFTNTTYVALYNNGTFSIVDSNSYYGKGVNYPPVGVGSWTNNKDLVCNFNGGTLFVHDQTIPIDITDFNMLPSACITSYNDGTVTGYFIGEDWYTGEKSIFSFTRTPPSTLIIEEIYSGITSDSASFVFGNNTTSSLIDLYFVSNRTTLSKIEGLFSSEWTFSETDLDSIFLPVYHNSVSTGSNHTWVSLGTNYAGGIAHTFTNIDIFKVEIESDNLSTQTKSGGGSYTQSIAGDTSYGSSGRTESWSGDFSHSDLFISNSSKTNNIKSYQTTDIIISDVGLYSDEEYTASGSLTASNFYPPDVLEYYLSPILVPDEGNPHTPGSVLWDSWNMSHTHIEWVTLSRAIPNPSPPTYTGVVTKNTDRIVTRNESITYTLNPLVSDGPIVLMGVDSLSINPLVTTTSEDFLFNTNPNSLGVSGGTTTSVVAGESTYLVNKSYNIYYNNTPIYSTSLPYVSAHSSATSSTTYLPGSQSYSLLSIWDNPNELTPITPYSSSSNHNEYTPGNGTLGKHYIYNDKMYAVKIPPLKHLSDQTNGVIVFFEVVNGVITSNILGTYTYSSLAYLGLNINRK